MSFILLANSETGASGKMNGVWAAGAATAGVVEAAGVAAAGVVGGCLADASGFSGLKRMSAGGGAVFTILGLLSSLEDDDDDDKEESSLVVEGGGVSVEALDWRAELLGAPGACLFSNDRTPKKSSKSVIYRP